MLQDFITDPLLTTSEVSKITGLAVGTLENWRCNGTQSLTFVKLGHKVRYRSSAVKAFIIANEKRQTD